MAGAQQPVFQAPALPAAPALGGYPQAPETARPQLGLPNFLAGLLGLLHPHSAGAFAGAAMQGQEQAAQRENQQREQQFRQMFEEQVQKNRDNLERQQLEYKAAVEQAQSKYRTDVTGFQADLARRSAAGAAMTAKDISDIERKEGPKVAAGQRASVLMKAGESEEQRLVAAMGPAQREVTAQEQIVGRARVAQAKATAAAQQKAADRKARAYIEGLKLKFRYDDEAWRGRMESAREAARNARSKDAQEGISGRMSNRAAQQRGLAAFRSRTADIRADINQTRARIGAAQRSLHGGTIDWSRDTTGTREKLQADITALNSVLSKREAELEAAEQGISSAPVVRAQGRADNDPMGIR
jgi:hypothetical protein